MVRRIKKFVFEFGEGFNTKTGKFLIKKMTVKARNIIVAQKKLKRRHPKATLVSTKKIKLVRK